jgi:hypothetical protein
MGKDNESARHSLIHLVRSGRSPEVAAEELDYSLSWAYKWWRRFNEGGWEELKSRSRAPHRHPNCISKKMQEMIVKIRRELEKEATQPDNLSYIGAYAIRGRMIEHKLKNVPSPSTIEKTLRLAGMTKPPRAEVEKKIMYPHLQIDHPHQLTQMDIVPHYLSGGALAHCFNAIDVRSRYPDGKQYAKKATNNVLDFCVKMFQNMGISEFTQMDNESSFNGGRTHQYVIGRVARLMLLVGTELVYSPFYHPESNAYVERFHQDYGKNVWEKIPMQDLMEVNKVSSRFFARYRISKHHSELDGQSPMSLHFEKPLRVLPKNFVIPNPLPITEGKIHIMRAVSRYQTISIFNVEWSAGLAEPDQGVWATLFITLRGASLRIFDQAPGGLKRRCFADHPFPLSESVIPLLPKFQKQKITWLEALFKLTAIDSTMS